MNYYENEGNECKVGCMLTVNHRVVPDRIRLSIPGDRRKSWLHIDRGRRNWFRTPVWNSRLPSIPGHKRICAVRYWKCLDWNSRVDTAWRRCPLDCSQCPSSPSCTDTRRPRRNRARYMSDVHSQLLEIPMFFCYRQCLAIFPLSIYIANVFNE